MTQNHSNNNNFKDKEHVVTWLTVEINQRLLKKEKKIEWIWVRKLWWVILQMLTVSKIKKKENNHISNNLLISYLLVLLIQKHWMIHRWMPIIKEITKGSHQIKISNNRTLVKEFSGLQILMDMVEVELQMLVMVLKIWWTKMYKHKFQLQGLQLQMLE
jgi:hypothetical protein